MTKKTVEKVSEGISVNTLDHASKEHGGEVHIHNEVQILAGKSGMLEVKVGSKKFNLRVGDVIFIKNCAPHSAKPMLPFTATVSIRIDDKNLVSPHLSEAGKYLLCPLSHFDDDYIYLRREDDSTSEMFSTISQICEENDKKDKSYKLFIEGYSKILLGLLKRQGTLKRSIDSLDTKAIEKIMPALSYVENNHTKEISLEEISKTLDMNREYFCRLFKKSIGVTFVDYVNLVRITHAKKLLISSQQNVTEISSKLGFSSVSYFTRVFKNITNTTPAEYRNIKLF